MVGRNEVSRSSPRFAPLLSQGVTWERLKAMRHSSADRVRALCSHASALVWAAAIALLSLLTPTDASAANASFIPNRGNAPAPDGAQAICQTYSWACARASARTISPAEQLKRVSDVNAKINRSVHAVEDDRQYGVTEVWALPTQAGGDCEDIALLKKRELVSQGVDPRRLLIATVLDRNRNPHAVLVFRSDRGDLVLDNLTDTIRTWNETRYVFLQMQDPDRPTAWINVFESG